MSRRWREINIQTIETACMHIYMNSTSSSAVADRPHDTSCLSVVSFSSTIHQVLSFIISYFGFWFTASYNWILLCSLLFDVLVHTAGCDKQSFNDTSPSVAINCMVSHRNCCSHVHQWLMDNQHFIQNRNFCPQHLHSMPLLRGPRRTIATRSGTQKLEWFGYPTDDEITRFDRIH